MKRPAHLDMLPEVSMKLCVGSQVVPLEMHKVLVDKEGQMNSMEKHFIIISDVKRLTWLE